MSKATALRETLTGLLAVLVILAIAGIISAAAVLWVMRLAQEIVK